MTTLHFWTCTCDVCGTLLASESLPEGVEHVTFTPRCECGGPTATWTQPPDRCNPTPQYAPTEGAFTMTPPPTDRLREPTALDDILDHRVSIGFPYVNDPEALARWNEARAELAALLAAADRAERLEKALKVARVDVRRWASEVRYLVDAYPHPCKAVALEISNLRRTESLANIDAALADAGGGT